MHFWQYHERQHDGVNLRGLLGQVMSRKSTFGLRAEQLAELLSVSVESDQTSDEISDEVQIAALLRHRLTQEMPKDSYVFDSIVTMLGRLGCDVQHLAGKSLGEILLDPEVDVGLLQTIKDHCKMVSGSLVSEAEASVATAIYYAAIASSIIHHDHKISHYPYETLGESFFVLGKKSWIPPELVRLFTRASKACKDKHEDK